MPNMQYPVQVILSAAKKALHTGRMFERDLAIFGLDTEYFDSFEALIAQGKSHPTEGVNRLRQRDLTDKQHDAIRECHLWGRGLRLRLQNVFGKDSPQYKHFPSREFNNSLHSASLMLEIMKVLLKIAEEYAISLKRAGLTEEVMEEGHLLYQELEEILKQKRWFRTQKAGDTIRRYQLMNELYHHVNQINAVGRTVFSRDTAKLVYFKSPWPKYGSKEEPESGIVTEIS
ncbi:MAG: hypothetical protein GF372_14925 [Candidatus Marinimicrobia bacterium]|nr:hypothetical protein [Candidatus Neomarinimicrobiota bacterium]